jgi:diguanylate cyclase (GGDEF)-like protein
MSTLSPHDYILRHEALLDLFAHLRRQTKLEAMAKVVAERWRFCGGVASWRLIYEDEPTLVLLDGAGSDASVKKADFDDLGVFDQFHWGRRLPAMLSRIDSEVARPLPPHLAGEAGQLVVMPLGERHGFGRSLLFAASSTPVFEKIDLKFIEALGAFFAGEVDALFKQGRLTAVLREQSLRDGLTGLANRRNFDERINMEWAAARRECSQLSLLMIDVDHFKLFNDRFGHPAGDACLQNVAKVLQGGAKRPHDLAARVGGEEFAVLLPRTDSNGALAVADRIREAIHALAIPHIIEERETIVTLSVGSVTMIPNQDGTSDFMREAADAALYRAKRGGRDRCVQCAA